MKTGHEVPSKAMESWMTFDNRLKRLRIVDREQSKRLARSATETSPYKIRMQNSPSRQN